MNSVVSKQISDPKAIKVAALYHFVAVSDYEALRAPLTQFCKDNGIKGTLLLAREGINGTVAGPREGIDALIAYLTAGNIFKGRFKDLDVKYSYAPTMPFLRMKVRLKQEIVTLRAPEADPTKQVGTYVQGAEWNEVISDPEMVVIDTRNDYEVALGTFKNALDPETDSFTEFKDWVAEHLDPEKNKKVAMFCTGGIRCEKASSYMLAHGFEQVYHLKGGILKYLEDMPEDESLWEGGCFVFDERVAVGHGLEVMDFSLCHACRMPLSSEDRASDQYEEGISCPHCFGKKSESELKRARERQRQVRLAEEKGFAHLGDEARKTRLARHKAKQDEKARLRAESLKKQKG